MSNITTLWWSIHSNQNIQLWFTTPAWLMLFNIMFFSFISLPPFWLYSFRGQNVMGNDWKNNTGVYELNSSVSRLLAATLKHTYGHRFPSSLRGSSISHRIRRSQNTVWCRYNAIYIPMSSQKTPHSSPVKARCWMYAVFLKSSSLSATFIAVRC